MKEIILTIGLNDKDTKKQEITTIDAYKIVQNICTMYVGGATIYETYGVYKHENGDIIEEKSLRIEIATDDKKAVIDVINVLKMALNQESVLYKEVESNIMFL